MTTIVLGWYYRKKSIKPPVIRELKVVLDTDFPPNAELDVEHLKSMIAYKMGHNYPKDIDYRYFDISSDDVD